MDYTLLVLPLTSHVILDMIWIQIIGVDLHWQLTAYLQDFGVIILQYVSKSTNNERKTNILDVIALIFDVAKQE